MTIARYETGPRMARAVAHGDLVFPAGQMAADVAADGVGIGVTAQTRQILEPIDRLLLKATVDLADLGGFAEMTAAWADRGNPSARATVEARLAGREDRVEIVITAGRGRP